GDVKSVLGDLMAQLKAHKQKPDAEALKVWWEQIREWQGIDCLRYDRGSKLIKPQFVIEKLYDLTGGDAYVTSDVGQHQMWAAQFYKFDKPRRWINSGGLGTMGFGMPAAMGVKLAFPDETVVCVSGEASLVMCIQELSTCLQYHLPVKIVMLNNRYMGMVRQWQEFFYDKRYSHSYMDALPDFVKLAESFGHVGMRIEKTSDVEGALKEALAMEDRLVLMDFVTDQTENVYPMIAAGKGQHEMHLSSERELA
ncbi:MAG: thiamine pyrophosphate-dependent enzyme, partial [Gammaproteobacteria bacterium]